MQKLREVELAEVRNFISRKLDAGIANTGCIQRGGAHTMVFQKDNAKDSKYTVETILPQIRPTPLESTSRS